MTPQKTHATERAIHEYRCASYEYICRHFKARLNHIVLRLTTTLKGDFACDPVLRCVYPFDDQMRACGLLDWSPHGSFQYALESEREASHRVFNIAVGGVTPLAWPAASFLGHVLYICIVADLVWEGWEEPGGGGALERWLETRAAAPDATVEERRAHDAYKRGTLSRWLDRQPSDFNYDLREFADYEAIRAQAMAPAGSEAEKEQLSAAARVGVRQEVRVTRFRLRAESWPRTFFGDPLVPGLGGVEHARGAPGPQDRPRHVGSAHRRLDHRKHDAARRQRRDRDEARAHDARVGVGRRERPGRRLPARPPRGTARLGPSAHAL